MRKIINSSLYLVLIFSTFCPLPTTADNARDKTLIIGKVSDNPQKHIKRLQPIVDYVASKMQDSGIEYGQVIFAKDNEEMIKLIKEGQVDWISETVFSALQFEQQAQASIFLKRWKKGQSEYYSVFFARRDSNITQLQQLVDKKLALEDPGSTTAFFLPVLSLIKQDIPIILLPSPRNPNIENKVNFIFAGGEVNIATWVYKGLADAGAFNNIDWDTEDHLPTAIKKDLQIFHRTEPYPRMLELLAPHVTPAVRKKLVQVLLTADSESEGITALNKYQNTARFELIDESTKMKLQKVRKMLPLTENLP